MRSTSGSRAPTGRRRHSSRSTRRTARCSPCTGDEASMRASSTSPCRASASRARRSSRSCWRRRSRRASRRRRRSSRSRCRSSSATATGTCTTTRASTSGRSTSSRRSRRPTTPSSRSSRRWSGRRSVVRTAHQVGITSPLQSVFSIGLGSQAVNPLEMARAYATFANGGYRVDGKVFGNRPRAITQIDDASGKTAFENAPVRKQVMSSTDAQLLTQLLQGVVTSGTGRAAALPNQPVAGKTGTTRELRRRVVRRLHAAARHGRVGRLPEGVAADADASSTADRSSAARSRREIWKTFMESALAAIERSRRASRRRRISRRASKRVTYRDGQIELDNGRCRDVSLARLLLGSRPGKTANCKVNEVEVPERDRLAGRRRPRAPLGAAADARR